MDGLSDRRLAEHRDLLIHPTALVADGATIGAGARIGPYCTVGPDVVIEERAHLISHVVVEGRTQIGADVVIYPFCSVGLAPQDLKYRGEPTGCDIGPRTQIREHCTIHRGSVNGPGTTRVGADCMLMAVVHVAHDCQLGSGVIIANNVVMGGHVGIADHAVIGGGAALHQFVRIGRAAMVGGLAGVEADVIPFGTVIGNRAGLTGLNVVGLKRRGFGKDEIRLLHAAVRELFYAPGVFASRLEQVRTRASDHPLIAEVLAFIDAPTRRGLIRTTRKHGLEEMEAEPAAASV
jgi:UDP-N-acetylglucosamine acyltransferase